MTFSPDFGAPLSTSTNPSAEATATTFAPPPSTMASLSVTQRALPVRCRGQLCNEFGEFLHVPGLDLHQLINTLDVVRVVRNRMKRVWHADMIVSPVRPFGHLDERRYAGEVGLVCQREQVEH